jgi:ubiquinol-cytochrome c reductase subunit 7
MAKNLSFSVSPFFISQAVKMMRKSAPLAFPQSFGSMLMPMMHFVCPSYFKDRKAVINTHKVERGLRIRTALKANKIDIRNLLALPVTDHAHPYKNEFNWERFYRGGDMQMTALNNMSAYGRWFRKKWMVLYELCLYHRFGAMMEDIISARGWYHRAARTRLPGVEVVHMDRRVTRYRWMRDRFIYDKKQHWVHPADNIMFFSPYIFMIVDEWEEKWGYFAGQEIEY